MKIKQFIHRNRDMIAVIALGAAVTVTYVAALKTIEAVLTSEK